VSVDVEFAKDGCASSECGGDVVVNVGSKAESGVQPEGDVQGC